MIVTMSRYYEISYGQDYHVLQIEKSIKIGNTQTILSIKTRDVRTENELLKLLIKVLKEWQGQKRIWSDDQYGFTGYVQKRFYLGSRLSNSTKENRNSSTTKKGDVIG